MIFNDLPKTFGIYKFTNKINGRIYIGKSNNLRYRIKHHLRKSANQVIDRAIKKYGLDNLNILNLWLVKMDITFACLV